MCSAVCFFFLYCAKHALNVPFLYRRRIMHYHMEAFKKVDVIATPTYNWVINAEVFFIT